MLDTSRRDILALGPALALGKAGNPANSSVRPLQAKALDMIQRVHAGRAASRPGNNAYGGLSVGEVYVQALARPAQPTIWLEAVSPRFAPNAWALRRMEKAVLLAELGFSPPGTRSPNFWQEVQLRDAGDLVQAARIAEAVLTEVFGVRDDARVNVAISAA